MTPLEASDMLIFLEQRIARDRKTIETIKALADRTHISADEMWAYTILSPQQSVIFRTLIASLNQWVGYYRIMEAMYGADEAGWKTEKGLHVVMHNLRNRLRKFRLPYTIETKHSTGYRLIVVERRSLV